MKNEIGECISIFIPNNQKEEFWEIIESAGYPKNSKGVFDFIMDEPDDIVGSDDNIITDWIKNNPEKIELIKEKGISLSRSLLSKIVTKI